MDDPELLRASLGIQNRLLPLERKENPYESSFWKSCSEKGRLPRKAFVLAELARRMDGSRIVLYISPSTKHDWVSRAE